MVQAALRWITMFDAVTCAIPGAKRPSQAEENFNAASLGPLPESFMDKVRTVYDDRVREHVHDKW